MATRFIKDSIWTSPNLNNLSDMAERHFYRLLPLPDDHGCCELTPAVVKGRCYPLKNKITVKEIAKWTQELVEEGVIRVWEEKGRLYGYFPTWSEHQRIRSLNKRRTPEPPADVVNCRQVSTTVADCGSLPPSLSSLPSSLSCPPDKPKIKEKRVKTSVPEKFEITQPLREWAIQNQIKLNLEKETQKFLNYHAAKGSIFSDWTAAWRNWMIRAMEFSGKSSPSPPNHDPPELSPLGKQAQEARKRYGLDESPYETMEVNPLKIKDLVGEIAQAKTI